MFDNLIPYDEPFIKLIETPYNKYVYEVNTNKIFRIDLDVYNALNNSSAPISDECQEKINQLKRQGKLLCYHPKKIVHQSSQSLPYHLDNEIRSITLQLTQQCNFRCAYCIYSEHSSEKQRTHSTKEMTCETAYHAVDFLFEHSRDISHVNIGFYGGEPLLKFDLIKNIIEYVEKEYYGKSVTYNITTNGSLINKEIIEYFIQHNVDIMISFDGPKETHDKYRHFAKNGKGTFDVVLSKILFIREEYPDFYKRIRFSAVIDPQSNLEEINTFFKNYQDSSGIVPNISILSDSYTSEKRYYTSEYIHTENNERIKVLLSCLGYTQEKYSSPVVNSFLIELTKLEDHLNGNYGFNIQTAPGGPCIPGTLRLFVDVDGNFFPCEHVSEKSFVMNIGDLSEGFDLLKVENLLNIAQLTEHSCRNCWAYHHCYQCAKFCDNIDTFSKELRRKECISVRRILENKLRYYIMINEIMERKNEQLTQKESYSLSI